MQKELSELIENSQNIAIFPNENEGDENIAAAYALKLILEKNFSKKAEVVSSLTPSEKLSAFLSKEALKSPTKEKNFVGDFIISINQAFKKIKELKYEKTDSSLDIILSSQDDLEPQDITFKTEEKEIKYDISFFLDYQSRKEVFSKLALTKININPEKIILINHNEQSEEKNYINLSSDGALSCGEVILNNFDQKQNKTIASLLLASMIISTSNLEKETVNWQNFENAINMIKIGADYHETVSRLYREKPLKAIKLAGRMLYKSEKNLKSGFYITSVTKDDLEDIKIDSSLTKIAVGILTENFPQTENIIVLEEQLDKEILINIFGRKTIINQLELCIPHAKKVSNSHIQVKTENNDINKARNYVFSLLDKYKLKYD